MRGGEPFWRFLEFTSRVEWCACFVSWCYNQAGYSEPRFAGCELVGVVYYRNNGRWENSGFTDLAPGDAIFFDWNEDGHSDHVGLVIGVDVDGVIYTVEGNSGDMVKIKKYQPDLPKIKGFGLM
jgi:cell wall-associated NlpC family hydrolase